MGPQNAVVGNDSYGTEMPQTQTPENAMAEISKAAKFSKTREFQELKDYLQAKIKFYQSNLPGGTPIVHVDPAIVGSSWTAADTIVREFQAIIDVYENAAQQLKDESARRKPA